MTTRSKSPARLLFVMLLVLAVTPLAASAADDYPNRVIRIIAPTAPGGTPRAIIDRLNRETIAVLKNPDYIKRLAEQGIEPVGSTPEEHTQYIKRELEKWAKVVKDTGVRID